MCQIFKGSCQVYELCQRLQRCLHAEEGFFLPIQATPPVPHMLEDHVSSTARIILASQAVQLFAMMLPSECLHFAPLIALAQATHDATVDPGCHVLAVGLQGHVGVLPVGESSLLLLDDIHGLCMCRVNRSELYRCIQWKILPVYCRKNSE